VTFLGGLVPSSPLVLTPGTDLVDVHVDNADVKAVQHDITAVVVARDDGVVLNVEPVQSPSVRVDA